MSDAADELVAAHRAMADKLAEELLTHFGPDREYGWVPASPIEVARFLIVKGWRKP